MNKKTKIKTKIIKMETIYENSIYIEPSKKKYNEYNQISLMNKLMEFYVSILKLIF
jgi:hypothetical protein